MSTARAELPGVTPDAPGRICTKIGVIHVTVDQISEVINQCRGISVNSIIAQVMQNIRLVTCSLTLNLRYSWLRQ